MSPSRAKQFRAASASGPPGRCSAAARGWRGKQRQIDDVGRKPIDADAGRLRPCLAARASRMMAVSPSTAATAVRTARTISASIFASGIAAVLRARSARFLSTPCLSSDCSAPWHHAACEPRVTITESTQHGGDAHHHRSRTAGPAQFFQLHSLV
jgi:hypothetical protein